MDRYVILGLSRPRETWFSLVGQWAADASIPVEFIRCVSEDELAARLATDRTHSAVLLDGGHFGADRDVISGVVQADCACIVIGDPAHAKRWKALGADAVLAAPFSRDELMEVLRAVSRATQTGDLVVDTAHEADSGQRKGRLVALTGPGGTGASTAAIALAQGLARPQGRGQARAQPAVLLADLCHLADQAVLHDAGGVAPCLSDFVDASRRATLTREDVRAHTFDVSGRGYRLLLGLRRREHWVALRGPSVRAAIRAMQDAADVVIADIDPDLQGARETGSHDVEDRNLLARTVAAEADIVVVIGEPSVKGVHALVRLVDEFVRFGVAADRLVLVVRSAPVSPAARQAVLTALRGLLVDADIVSPGVLNRPLLLPRWRPEGALHAGAPLPRNVPDRLAREFREACHRLPPRDHHSGAEPITVHEVAAEGGAPW